jgi:hypothetical protein
MKHLSLFITIFSFNSFAQLLDTLPTSPEKKYSFLQIYVGTGLPFIFQMGASLTPVHRYFIETNFVARENYYETRIMGGIQKEIIPKTDLRFGIGWVHRHETVSTYASNFDGFGLTTGLFFNFYKKKTGLGWKTSIDLFFWDKNVYPSAQLGLVWALGTAGR